MPSCMLILGYKFKPLFFVEVFYPLDLDKVSQPSRHHGHSGPDNSWSGREEACATTSLAPPGRARSTSTSVVTTRTVPCLEPQDL